MDTPILQPTVVLFEPMVQNILWFPLKVSLVQKTPQVFGGQNTSCDQCLQLAELHPQGLSQLLAAPALALPRAGGAEQFALADGQLLSQVLDLAATSWA